ncbi:MarR family winged helix-turn-helix transcriptional regulator [Ideonella sp. DXS22W]|uniref:MarR family winged helix-turn-helix transcriptional regulator n=1 Tax=Pseudaquabacterium inlustre TaxID=2984192 RepID=A0ABU9CPC7_9BURK
MKKTPVSRTTAAAPRRLKLGPLRDNLGYLTRVLRNVTQQSSARHVDDLGHATGQITMLGLIAANEGVSQNELAGAMLMRKSQVTSLIQDLVERGLVQRAEQGGDRRYNALTLTPPGQQAWKRARDRIHQHSDELLGALSPDEREQLTALVRKLLAAHLQDAEIDFD